MNNKTIFIILFTSLYWIGCQGQEKPVIQDEAAKEAASLEKEDKQVIVAEPATSANNQESKPSPSLSEKKPLEVVTTLQWREVNAFQKTISYSKIAETGKVSVFILATYWCGSCKKLRKDLNQHPELADKVDFYYINMCPKGADSKEMESSTAYKYIRHIDRLKEWPRVVITSPTGSIVKSFSPTDLKRECQERTLNQLVFNEEGNSLTTVEELKSKVRQKCTATPMYEKTMGIINRLLEHQDKFVQANNLENWKIPTHTPTAAATTPILDSEDKTTTKD